MTSLGAAIAAVLIIVVFFFILDPTRYIRSKKKERQEEEKKLKERTSKPPLSRMSLYLRRPFNRSSISPKNESVVHPYSEEIPLESDKRSVSFSVDPPNILNDGTSRRGGLDDDLRR